MTFRVAQISDTHLSDTRPLFDGNFPPVAAALLAARPDLVIHTGDLSLDGADSVADLLHGARLLNGLGLPWRAIPGNHDVGDDAVLQGKQPVTPERLARWERCVGPLHFVYDIPGWRLIGLDTQGFSTNPAHRAAVAEAIAAAGECRIALFQHKPITEEALDDTAVNYWPLLPQPRAELLSMFGQPPALIASGHVHQARDRIADDIRQIWAPAVGFIVGDAWQHRVGEKLLGWVEHEFHPSGRHEAHLRVMPDLPLHDIGGIPQAYGTLRKLA